MIRSGTMVAGHAALWSQYRKSNIWWSVEDKNSAAWRCRVCVLLTASLHTNRARRIIRELVHLNPVFLETCTHGRHLPSVCVTAHAVSPAQSQTDDTWSSVFESNIKAAARIPIRRSTYWSRVNITYSLTKSAMNLFRNCWIIWKRGTE